MLRYLNRGRRDSRIWDGQFPEIVRGSWEIMLIVNGAACPIFRGEATPKYLKRRLWVIPPRSRHSWKADPAQGCEVIVAHLASLHPVMDNYISRKHPTSVPISAADVKRVERLYATLLVQYRKPRLTSNLFFEQGMLEFCQIIIQNMERSADVGGATNNSTRVQQALLWHQEHLAAGCSVREVAAALHVSPSHLRRMFEDVLGDAPKRIFQQAALERACRMMGETNFSLKEIAYKCGYHGFSQFYRAFRQHYQVAPEAWRKNSAYGDSGPGADDRPAADKKAK